MSERSRRPSTFMGHMNRKSSESDNVDMEENTPRIIQDQTHAVSERSRKPSTSMDHVNRKSSESNSVDMEDCTPGPSFRAHNCATSEESRKPSTSMSSLNQKSSRIVSAEPEESPVKTSSPNDIKIMSEKFQKSSLRSTHYLDQDSSETESADSERTNFWGSDLETISDMHDESLVRPTVSMSSYGDDDDDSSAFDCVNPNLVLPLLGTSTQHPLCDSREDPQEPIPSTSSAEPASSSNLLINPEEGDIFQRRNRNKKDSKIHKRSNRGIEKYNCPKCNEVFKGEKKFKTHMLLHSVKHSVPCPTCGRVFKDMRYLKQHASSHSVERPLFCCTQGSACKGKPSLKKHGASNSHAHRCEVCGKAFKRKGNLIRHMDDNHPNP